MPMCYNKLWKMLIDRNLNKTDLKKIQVLVLMYWLEWVKMNQYLWKVLKKFV